LAGTAHLFGPSDHGIGPPVDAMSPNNQASLTDKSSSPESHGAATAARFRPCRPTRSRHEMEEMMHMPDQEPRRLPDGSLDFDFYRQRAARERAQLWHDVVSAMAAAPATTLIAAAVVLVALYLIPAADGTGWNGHKAGDGVVTAANDSTARAKF
jgi:hypothetical protein